MQSLTDILGNPKPIHYTHAFLNFFDAVRTLPIANFKRPHNVSALELGHNDHFYMGFPFFHLVGELFRPCAIDLI